MSISKKHTESKDITKDELDLYFKELSKELKKEFGRNANIELIVVGGASVLLNYGFRDTTKDIDAIISSRSSIKEAVNRVGDKYNLENGWVNSDFKQTSSYSPKLLEHSKYYRTYNQILTVRTIGDEYLVAMKLASMRNYKNDLSDIIGIINSERGTEITYERIDKAVVELYGGWNKMPGNSNSFIKSALINKEKNLYENTRNEEIKNKELLVEFENNYDNVLKDENVDNILNSIKAKRNSSKIVENKSESILKKLNQCKQKVAAQNIGEQVKEKAKDNMDR